MKLREEASTILGMRIEPDRWKQEIMSIDQTGAMTKRKQMEIIIMLCERLEKLEEYVYTNKS